MKDDDIYKFAENYLNNKYKRNCSFETYFKESFDVENVPSFNKKIKIVLVAEDTGYRIIDTCQYLFSQFLIDIMIVEFKLYSAIDNSFYLESKQIHNTENDLSMELSSPRWNEPKLVADVVYEAVLEFTNGNPDKIFTSSDIKPLVLKQFPDFKTTTLMCNIYAHCVGHPSRHHYSGRKDYYEYVSKGQYKLFKKPESSAA